MIGVCGCNVWQRRNAARACALLHARWIRRRAHRSATYVVVKRFRFTRVITRIPALGRRAVQVPEDAETRATRGGERGARNSRPVHTPTWPGLAPRRPRPPRAPARAASHTPTPADAMWPSRMCYHVTSQRAPQTHAAHTHTSHRHRPGPVHFMEGCMSAHTAGPDEFTARGVRASYPRSHRPTAAAVGSGVKNPPPLQEQLTRTMDWLHSTQPV